MSVNKFFQQGFKKNLNRFMQVNNSEFEKDFLQNEMPLKGIKTWKIVISCLFFSGFKCYDIVVHVHLRAHRLLWRPAETPNLRTSRDQGVAVNDVTNFVLQFRSQVALIHWNSVTKYIYLLFYSGWFIQEFSVFFLSRLCNLSVIGTYWNQFFFYTLSLVVCNSSVKYFCHWFLTYNRKSYIISQK